MRLSGSETISTIGQVERIARSANVQDRDRLHIVDVRQESHVVADRYALTLRGLKDWANVGLSHEEALQSEADWIGDLRRSENLTIYSAEDMKSGARPMRSVTLHRPEIVSEQALVERTGANYARLTVTDHLRPGDDAVDRFVEIVRRLPSDAALHVHCKGGKGRTTTFMAIYDMLRNAGRVSADGIIDRQGELGRYQLKKIDGQNADYRQDRLSFLYAFHEYATRNPDGQPQTWSAWLASRRTPAPGLPMACRPPRVDRRSTVMQSTARRARQRNHGCRCHPPGDGFARDGPTCPGRRRQTHVDATQTRSAGRIVAVPNRADPEPSASF